MTQFRKKMAAVALTLVFAASDVGAQGIQDMPDINVNRARTADRAYQPIYNDTQEPAPVPSISAPPVPAPPNNAALQQCIQACMNWALAENQLNTTLNDCIAMCG